MQKFGPLTFQGSGTLHKILKRVSDPFRVIKYYIFLIFAGVKKKFTL